MDDPTGSGLVGVSVTTKITLCGVDPLQVSSKFLLPPSSMGMWQCQSIQMLPCMHLGVMSRLRAGRGSGRRSND